MAHACGINTRSYTAVGDGIEATRNAAITSAATEYRAAVARIMGKLLAWAFRPCPAKKCGVPVFMGIQGAGEYAVGVVRPDGRHQVHITQTYTGTMKCIAMPHAKKGVKKAAKKPARRKKRAR
jgi:hypothetical protein